ncbi:MAG: DUF3857 domain-containing protein [Ignavibacteria bacterium]|nr:DUF3857 domain-containing protein [Ignavibacteria bacterium]
MHARFLSNSRFATILALSVACCMTGAFAQTAEKDADATYLDITHEYVLNPDGSTVFSYEHHLQYHTYYAFTRAYGESFIVTNPAWQTLKIGKVETKMADGTVVKAPFNAFNEILPGFAANAAPYLHLREMVVTHTGLERGAVADFSYTVTTKPGMLPGLSGRVIFGDRCPIQSYTVKVKVPKGVKLASELRRSDVKPAETTEGKWTVWTWRLAKLPMYPVESQQQAIDQAVPVLYFSTASFADVQKHIGADSPVLFDLDDKARRDVFTATKGDSPVGQARTLRKNVESLVGGMGGDLAVLGFKPMPAQRTFNANVGSALDKAVLLAAMYRVLKLDAVPVLTSPVNTVPALQAFTGAAVLIEGVGTGGALLLDASAPQSDEKPARLAGQYYLRLDGKSDKCERIDSDADANALALTTDISIDGDGLVSGKARVESGGVFGLAFDLKRLVSGAKRVLATTGQGLTVRDDGSGMAGEGRSFCDAGLSTKTGLTATGGLVKFCLPTAPGGIDEMHVNLGLAGRSTPLEFAAPFAQESRITLTLPKDWTIASLSDDQRSITVSNDAGEVRSTVRGESGSIEIVRSFRLKRAVSAPAQYAEVRALLAAWRTPLHGTLYFTVPAR